jgi:iron-sulfur cluster assembly accessory protein
MISISKEAEAYIKSIISRNPGKTPKIILKKGGCAGQMLLLILDTLHEDDDFVEVKGLKIAVTYDAKPFVGNVEICLKNNLCSEVIIRNNEANTCRCGKSFKA